MDIAKPDCAERKIRQTAMEYFGPDCCPEVQHDHNGLFLFVSQVEGRERNTYKARLVATEGGYNIVGVDRIVDNVH